MTSSNKAVASTAFGPIVVVAIEQRQSPATRLVDDSVAASMLPLGLRLLVRAMRWKLLEGWVFRASEDQMPGIRASMLCRKRYINDVTLSAIEGGIEQVVILGAGLDTSAYRLPSLADKMTLEVDLPENSEYKRARLKSLYGQVPEHVRLVSLDFDRDDLLAKLSESGYDPGTKSLFIWEGVTQYLREDGVRKTLALLGNAAPGSKLVFTYVLKEFLTGRNLFGAEKGYERFVVKQKLWHFALDPDEVAPLLSQYGWHEDEQVGPLEYDERYIAPTGRRLRAMEVEPCVLATRID